MAAIVSGNSLGLLNSSLYVLGAQGALGQSPQGRSGEQVFVNGSSGNLVIQNRDELLIGRGPDLSLLRTYNSQGLLDGDNNDNWRFGVYRKVYNLTGTVNTAGSTVTRVAEDGSESLYTFDATLGKYVCHDGGGSFDTLSFASATQTWTWSWTDGTSQLTELYDNANGGRITRVQDQDGNALTFTYNAAGLITQVTDASGETTFLDYTGTDLTQLRTVTADNPAKTIIRTRYAYDASHRLTTVTTDLTPENTADSSTYVVNYTYDGTSKRVATLTQTDGNNLSFSYVQVGTVFKLQSTTDATGKVTSFAYTQSTNSVPASANANNAVLSTTDTQTTTTTVAPYYTVVSGDTWTSITQTVYGTSNANAVAALQSALGNPALTAGTRLTVPQTINYNATVSSAANGAVLSTTTTTTVAPYYTVASGNTWISITQAVYGTSNANAVAALQSALGNPALTAGTRLTVPQTLSYSNATNIANANGAVLSTTETQSVTRNLNSGALSTTDTVTASLNNGALTAAGWAAATTALDNLTQAASVPQIGFDSQGRAVAVWLQNSHVFASRYSANVWSTPVQVDNRTNAVTVPQLFVDAASGNAIATWVQSDGTANSTYVARFVNGAWATPELVENLSPTTNTTTATSASINGTGKAVVAFVQAGKLFANVYNGTAWGTLTTVPQISLTANTNAVSAPSATIDSSGKAIVTWQQNAGTNTFASIFANVYNGTSWAGATEIDTSTTLAATAPQVRFDGTGKAWTVFIQNGDLLARQWNGTAWVAGATNLETGSAAVSSPQLYVDASGKAAVAWVQNNPTVANVFVNRFNGTSWSGAQAVSTSGSAQSLPTVTINASGTAVVAYLQTSKVFTSRFNGTSWSAGAAIPNGDTAAISTQASIGLDAQGNAAAVWAQDATANIYSSYYDAAAYYKVPASATWNTIAQALYGNSGLGSTLQSAMGSPTLSTNLHLKAFPASITGPGTVPAYYTVPASPSWASIATALYGNADVVPELQAALGTSTVPAAGTHLTGLPASLTHTSTVTVAPYYTVQAGNTWSSIAQTVYGDTAAAGPLQTALGNPTLTTGLHLTVPASLSFTPTTAAANAAALSTTDTQTTNYSLNSGALTNPAGGWAAAAAVETSSAAVSGLVTSQNNSGDAVAAWLQGGSVFASAYDDVAQTWSAAVNVSGAFTNASGVKIDVDHEAGNAVVTWTDTTTNKVYANRGLRNGATLGWQGAQLVATVTGTLAEAAGTINKWGTSAVMWRTTSGTTQTLAVSRWSGTAWSAPEQVASGTVAITAPQVTSTVEDVIQVVWRASNGSAESVFSRGYAPATGWGTTATLNNPGAAVSFVLTDTDIWADTNVGWVQGNDIYVNWGGEGQGWNGAMLVATSPSPVSQFAYSDSAGSNSVFAWLTTDGKVYAYRWGTSAPDLLGTGTGLTDLAAYSDGSTVVVSWRAGNDLYASSHDGAAWSTPALIEASSQPASTPRVAVANGQPFAIWQQSDGTANSIFASRYLTGGTGSPYYTVQANDTWANIAQLLYGNSAAGSALQSAMGNPTLTTGAQLTGFPATLSVTTTVTVAPYYLVPSGATWGTVTQAVYGTSDANAQLALRDALGATGLTPAPVVGAKITMPASIRYAGAVSTLTASANAAVLSTTITTTVAPYYTVTSTDTWTSITQTVYGTSNANAVAALQSALGNPTLSTGLRLTVPATISYTASTSSSANAAVLSTTITTTTIVTVAPYYSVQTGDTWAGIAQTVYGNSQAGSALQTALSGGATPTVGAHLTVPQTLNYTQTVPGDLRTDITDPLGLVTSIVTNPQGQLTQLLNPAVGGVRQSVSYTYNANGDVTQVTDARGLVTTYDYDANGNRKLERDAAGNTITRVFGSKNELQTETSYVVPDPDGAGAGQPGTPLTTRYVYDANTHLRFVISAEGRVTEYRYNGLGQRVAAIQYTGQYTGALYDVSTLTPTQTPTETQLLSFVNAADKTKTQRVDSTYDFRGQLATTTSYARVDTAGTGVADGSQSVTQYVYDQAGNLLKTIDPRGTPTAAPNDYATAYTYDGLGRQTSTIVYDEQGLPLATVDAQGRTSVTQYDDAGRKTVLNSANGLVTTSTYNTRGELVSVMQSSVPEGALGTTSYFYDADGRLRRTVDPTGVALHVLYDEAGRKIATIDGTGSLTEYRYDADNNLIRTIQYATAVTAANLASLSDAQGNPTTVALAAIRPAASGQDRITANAYDSANRLVKSMDELGFVTQYFYDGAGRQTDVLRSATPIGLTLPGTAGSYATTPDSAANSVTGDIDIRVRVTLADWTPATTQALVAKNNGTLSYLFEVESSGRLSLYASPDGATVPVQAISGVATGVADGNASWVRVTRVAASGAVAFYTSGDYAPETGSGTWTQLGTTTGLLAAGNLFDSAVGVEIGTRAGGTTDPVNGKIYYAEIRSGINGAVGAKFDPRDAALTASTSFASGTGETWTLAGSAAINTTSSADDRLTRNFYDTDGKLRGTLDGEGYLVEYKYDAAGQLSETIGYATLTDPTKRITGTLAQLIATTPTSLDDIHSFALYNAKGQMVGVVDGEGYLTETVYDAAGNKAQSIRYGTRVTYTPGVPITSIRPRASLALPGVVGSFASTPDTAANSVTGDLDLRALIAPTDWTPPALQEIIDKSATDSSQFSYLLRLNPDGRLVLYWSSNGTTLTAAASTVPVPAADGTAKWVRATLAVGNSDIRFYTSDDGATWTPLGAAVTIGGATSIFNGTAPLRLGVRNDNATSPFSGRLYYAEVRNGINGTVVAKFNPAGDAASLSSTSFTSSIGEAWTLAGTAVLSPGGPQDQLSTYTYTALNQLASETNPEGTLTTYTYDSVGHLTQSVKALNTADARGLSIHYDKLGRVTEQLSGNGVALLAGAANQTEINNIWAAYATHYTYDEGGRRTSATDPDLRKTLYYYDADGQLNYTVNALGEVTQAIFNALGQLTKTVQYGTRLSPATLSTLTTLGGGLVNQTLTNAVSGAGGIANALLDSATTYAYTLRGEVASATDPLTFSSSQTYDAFGDAIATSQQIASGQTLDQTFAFDRRGLLKTATVVDPAQANFVRATQYDAFGRATQTTDARGNVRKQSYDRMGRVVTTTVDPGAGHLNLVTTTAYDAFSRVLTQTDALGAITTYAYDTANRSVKVTTPEGVVLSTVKNRLGEVQNVTDGRGKTTSYLYDKDGNLKQVDAPGGDPTVNTYDNAGLLITVDANGTSTAYAYDAAGRVHTRTVDPGHLNLVTTYEYDAKGQGVLVKDAKGVFTQTEFDLKGQVKSVTVDPGSPAAGFLNLTTTYTYDGRGKTLTVTEGAGSAKPRVTLYTYDKLGRLLSQRVDPNVINATTTYVYDKNNNVAKKTDANGNATRFIYDADDRLVYTIDALGGVTKNDYDADGRVIRTTAYAAPLSGFAGLPDVATLGNITLAQPTGVDEVTGHVYDKDGRERYVIQIIDGLGNVTQKDYDANGNVVRTVGYAVAIPAGTPLTQAQFELALAPQQGAAANRVTRTVYDGANRAVYEIDALNYVKETHYNSDGRVSRTIQYALPVSIDPTPNVAEVDAALSADSTPLALPGTTGSYASTPDTVKNSVTGDIDMRVLLTHDSWAPATAEEFITKDDLAASRDYGLRFNSGSTGKLQFVSSLDGSNTTPTSVVSTAATGFIAGSTHWVRVTRSASTGDVKFFTSDDYNASAGTGTWTQLGATLATTPGALHDGTSILQVGSRNAASPNDLPFKGKIYYAEVRSGIDGTLAAKFNPSADAASAGVRSFASATGEVWTLAGTAALSTARPDQINTFVYDKAGRLTQSTDAEGFTETYGYDAVGNKTSFTNKKGATWDYVYDAAGRMTSETSPYVDVTALTTDAAGVVSAAQPVSARIETRITYDALGNVLTRTEGYGRPGEARQTQYDYDALGRQTTTTLPSFKVYDRANDNLATNGMNGTVQIVETQPVAPQTIVTFDALGNAVINRDADGKYTYKVYDALRRLKYEIDAKHYVTEYGYDTFGNNTSVKRYANPLNFGAVAGFPVHTDGTKFTLAEMSPRLIPDQGDRAVTTQYDVLNRAFQVTQPAVFSYDPTATGLSPQYVPNVGATMRSTYNAFGQVIKQSALSNPGVDLLVGTGDDTWFDTYFYYNRRGDRTAQVDALGYLTTWEYDETGDLTREVQYAAKLPSPWTTSGFGAPTLTTPQSNPGIALGYDRETTYQYDRKNQKIAETRVNSEFGTVTGTVTLGTAVGNLTTKYAYDAVGNMVSTTDPTGATTFTYYDVLGRVVAVAEPSRSGEGGSGVVVMPPVYVSYNSANNTTTATFAKNAPADSVVAFLYRVAGTAAGFTPVPLQVLGNNYMADLTGLTSDRYEYQLTYSKPGLSTPYATGTGQLSIVGPTTTPSVNVTSIVEQPTFSKIASNSGHYVMESDGETGFVAVWNGANTVSLSWNSLGSLGTGDVLVRINYTAYAYGGGTLFGLGASTFIDRPFSGAEAVTGATVSWMDGEIPDVVFNGGIAAIDSVQVWKMVNGQQVLVINSASDYVQPERLLLRGNTAGLTAINVAGVGTLAATSLGGGVYSVSLAGLGRGTYSFTPVGTATPAVGGTFDVTRSTAPGNAGLQETNATSVNRTLNAFHVPSNAVSAVLQYRPSGNTGPFLTKTFGAVAAGEFSASYDDIGNGSYDYILTARDSAGAVVNLGGAGGTLTGTIKIRRGGELPSVTTNASASNITPLTVMGYNAFGEVVQSTKYARGALNAAATGYGIVGTDTNDQASFNFYDGEGHIIRSIDPERASAYRSYDIFGHVAKTWQKVTNSNDGTVMNAVQVFTYDELGRQIETLEPSYLPLQLNVPLDPANFVANQVTYNAFGEIISKGQKIGAQATQPQEYYQYDNAGHLWHTNEKDGVDKVILFDLLGRSTAQILSQMLDLRNVSAPQAAAGLASGVQRTNSEYDALGRLQRQTQPSLTIAKPTVAAYPTPLAISNASLSINSYSPAHDEVSIGEHGVLVHTWNANTSISLGWSNLSYLGNGNVYVYIDYITAAGTGGAFAREVDSATAANGVNLSWQDFDGGWGTGYVYRVRVWKRDASGLNLIPIFDQGGSGSFNNLVTSIIPPEVNTGVTANFTIYNMGARYLVNTLYWGAGTYDLEVLYQRPGETTPYAHSTGRFASVGGVISSTTADVNVVPVLLTSIMSQTVDRWGNVLSVKDARNYTTNYRYNYLGQMIEEMKPETDVWGENGLGPKGRPTVRNFFDQMGRGIGTIDANGNASSARYDAAGQLVAEYHADGGTLSYQYDAFGRRIRMIDLRQKFTDYLYDHDDRLVQVKHPIGTETYTYDEAGNRVRVTVAATATLNLVTKYWYDSRGNVIKTQVPGTQVTSDFYDSRGNKIREVNAANDQLLWTYDYFGRLQSHTDMGGGVYNYFYDRAGHIKEQQLTRPGNAMVSTTYEYYENGWVKRITDNGVRGETLYEYDAAGNRTRERYVKDTIVYRDDRTGYDELGRVISVKDNRVQSIAYGYDRNGNRRFVKSSYFVDGSTTPQTSESWYRYDQMNRILLSQGKLTAPGGSIYIDSTQGIILEYNAAGDRVNATTTQGGTEGYTYDDNGRLKTTVRTGKLTSSRDYDLAGRVTTQVSYSTPDTINERRENVYDDNSKLLSQTIRNGSNVATQSTTYDPYDAAGNVTRYQTAILTGPQTYTNTYIYTYEKYDSYKEKNIAGTSTFFQSGNTSTTYDLNGNILSVDDRFAGPNRFRTFVTDGTGQILQKTENGQTQYYFYANDKGIGSSGGLSAADFDYNYTPVSDQYPATVPGVYVASQGDTLRSIALTLFGDAQLWYIIADANGIKDVAGAIKPGTQLTIPNKITNLHNDSTTFKVYAPGQIIGDTAPTLPDPPPPPPPPHKKGCGGLGMVIMIVVAVVATIFTAGAAAVALGATMASGGLFATGMAALAGGGALMGAGVAMAAAAVGGAIGSIASQAVGMKTGNVEKFSWRQVGVAAIGSAVTAGMGAIGAAGSGGLAGQAGITNSTAQAAFNAAAGNAITQQASRAAHLQDGFNWSGMAAAGVSAAVAQNVSIPKVPNFEFAADFGNRVISGGVRQAVQNHGKVDWKSVGADAFGNAAGNAIVAEIRIAGMPDEIKKMDAGRGAAGKDANGEDFNYAQRAYAHIMRTGGSDGLATQFAKDVSDVGYKYQDSMLEYNKMSPSERKAAAMGEVERGRATYLLPVHNTEGPAHVGNGEIAMGDLVPRNGPTDNMLYFQRVVDFFQGGAGTNESYIHAMRGDTDDATEGRQKINYVFRQAMSEAFGAAANDDGRTARMYAVMGLHILQDSTSAAHRYAPDPENPNPSRDENPRPYPLDGDNNWPQHIYRDSMSPGPMSNNMLASDYTALMFDRGYVPQGDILNLVGVDPTGSTQASDSRRQLYDLMNQSLQNRPTHEEYMKSRRAVHYGLRET